MINEVMEVNPKAVPYVGMVKDKNGRILAYIDATPDHIPLFITVPNK